MSYARYGVRINQIQSNQFFRVVEAALVSLRGIITMTVCPTCGWHFCILLHDDEWGVEEVPKVARALLWFEKAAEVLVPEQRRIVAVLSQATAPSA
jgi:hypothetical protein